MAEDEECTVNCVEENTALTLEEIKKAITKDTTLR